MCDFLGAVLGTLFFIYFVDYLMPKLHVLYDFKSYQKYLDEMEEKERLIR